MHLWVDATILCILVGLYAIYRRHVRITVTNIPGPEPESFLLGNLRELLQGEAAEADFRWQEQFGDVIKIQAPFGEERLLIMDPKALQYIYHTSKYNFPKPFDIRELTRLVAGRGIFTAEGDHHKRHRKVLLLAFGSIKAKESLSVFLKHASKITAKWTDSIVRSDNESLVFNVSSWLSRATLDSVGEVVFDCDFGAMDEADNALVKAYSNFMLTIFASPTIAKIFFQNICHYLPNQILQLLVDYSPDSTSRHARETGRVVVEFAKLLLKDKTEALSVGKGNRDVMTLLVQANASEGVKMQLNEEEILAQMQTLMLAGHESTTNTITWALLELCRHPEVQIKLREEIRATERAVHNRGDLCYSPTDFEAMPYTTAFIKEVLRFHPIAYHTFREAGQDDVLPLSKPIRTTTGELINEIPIPSGLKLILSIAGYNRNESMFGADAHSFNPERWLDGSIQKTEMSLGVCNNLLTFAGGVRSCLGWQFAINEMQAFLVEMVNSFEFSLTPEAQEIRREGALVMIPTIEGRVGKGAQLPLRVSIAARD